MNACQYLGKQRVNIELMLWENDKGILHYGVRLRPWKQDTRVPSMILVQGLSLEDAMNNAARSHFKNEWIALDYAARPWDTQDRKKVDPMNASDLDFFAPDMATELQKDASQHIRNLNRQKTS
jgi:hypothetical protein